MSRVHPEVDVRVASAPVRRVLRPDIQGLRMLAVTAVVLDHLLGWPTGGFVGVDVFFVISGFLITGLLLREYESTGSISFSGFYRRRVKRIVPAAVTVLVVTTVAAHFLLNSARSAQAFTDALWSFFFAANWHFAATGTDYFLAGAATSPLQHFWSLAVEEQFYLVWPWLLVLIFFLGSLSASWTSANVRRAAGLAMGIIVVASFGWALWESATSPTVAYFSTLSRTWELGVGALVAVVAPALSRIPSACRPILGWIGLAGILASIALINDTLAFPAPWAAVPVLATALVIVAGTGGELRFLFPLTNRVSGFVGTLSYSLYLWHFPVIILTGALIAPTGPLFVSVCVLGMLALSVSSFYLVERPIHRSGSFVERLRLMSEREGQLPVGGLVAAAVALVVVVLVVVAVQPRPGTGRAVPDPASSVAFDPASPSAPATPGAAAATIVAGISAAAEATSWPDLSPSVAQLNDSRAPEWTKDGCLFGLHTAAEGAGFCVYGSGVKQAVLLGDSVAISWSSAIRAALGSGWTLHILTLSECPAALVSVTRGDRSAFPNCDTFHAWAASEIERIRPAITFVSSAQNSTSRLVSGATGTAALSEWTAGVTANLTAVRAASASTVLLEAPPEGKNLQVCVTPFNSPADCVNSPSSAFFQQTESERAAVTGLDDPTVSYLPTVSWFCTPERICPSFSGRTPILADGNHLTSSYSAMLGPVLGEAVAAQRAAAAG